MTQTAYQFTDLDTFTRASTKMAFNQSGVLAQVASGQPAFPYDPIALTLRGLQIEEGATNLLYPSADANAFLNVQVGMTIGGTPAVAPDGTSTMKEIIASAVAGNHYTQRANWIVNAQQPLVFECWLKAGAFSSGFVEILDGQAGANYVQVTFNLATGTVTSAVAAGTAVIMSTKLTPYPNGVYKLEVVAQPTTNVSQTTLTFQVTPLNNGAVSYTGDGTSGLYIGGMSLKASSSPSSYIPTTTAAASRSADVAQLSATALAAMQGYLASGTFYLYARLPNAAPAAHDQVLMRMDDGTNNNFIEITNPAGTTNIACQIVAAGATVFQQVGGTFVPGSFFKVAVSMAPSNFSISVNGGTAINGATGAIPMGLTECWLGSRSGTSAFMNGEINDFGYYSPRYAATDMPALTT
jgi:hypothetical protein